MATKLQMHNHNKKQKERSIKSEELEEFKRVYLASPTKMAAEKHFGVPPLPDALRFPGVCKVDTGTNSGSFTATNLGTNGLSDGTASNSPHETIRAYDMIWNSLSVPNCPPITQPEEKEMNHAKKVRKLIRGIINDPAKEALIEKYYNMDADTLFFAMLDPKKLFEAALALEAGAREEEE